VRNEPWWCGRQIILAINSNLPHWASEERRADMNEQKMMQLQSSGSELETNNKSTKKPSGKEEQHQERNSTCGLMKMATRGKNKRQSSKLIGVIFERRFKIKTSVVRQFYLLSYLLLLLFLSPLGSGARTVQESPKGEGRALGPKQAQLRANSNGSEHRAGQVHERGLIDLLDGRLFGEQQAPNGHNNSSTTNGGNPGASLNSTAAPPTLQRAPTGSATAAQAASSSSSNPNLNPNPSSPTATQVDGSQNESARSPLECTNGLLTFELLTGYIYKPSSALETLSMMPSTLQLTDCLDYCLKNSSCLATNFEMGLCVLLASSARQNQNNLYTSQFPVFTIYAEKKCLLKGEYMAAA